MTTGAELGCKISAFAMKRANAIFRNGVAVSGASFQGENRSTAIHSNVSDMPGVWRNGCSPAAAEGGTVDQIQLLFDRRQAVHSAGLTTVSYLPNSQTRDRFEEEIVAGICARIPHIHPLARDRLSPESRRTLRDHEAQTLLADRVAG